MREKILSAAERAIGSMGNDFTMGQLATAVGISKRILYEHFRDKEEIVALIVLSQLRDIIHQVHNITNDDRVSIRECLCKCIALQPRSYPLITLSVKGKLLQKYPNVHEQVKTVVQEYWQELEQYLQKQRQAGTIKQVSVHTVILLLQTILHDHVHRKVINHECLDEKEIVEMLEVILVGLLHDAEGEGNK